MSLLNYSRPISLGFKRGNEMPSDRMTEKGLLDLSSTVCLLLDAGDLLLLDLRVDGVDAVRARGLGARL